jgi:hypothetical protein
MESRNRPFKFPVSILIGSTPINIFRVIKGYRIDLRYYFKFFLTIIISLIFEIFNFFEDLVYKKRAKSIPNEEPPIFIIGFWRSGTTILHSLLCQDPKAGYVTTFQGVFPNLVLTQKKWLKALINSILPNRRPFDGYALDMDLPQEEDFALLSLQGKSIYKLFYFPKDFDTIYDQELHFDRYSLKEQKRWKKKYQTFVHKAMLNTNGQRYMSKNPCNIFRIKTLMELYPQARFVFIYRNPYTVVDSISRFFNEILPGSELQRLEGGLPRKHFARLYKDSLDEYIKVKNEIKPSNLLEIKYEEFKKHPIQSIRDIYTYFNISGFEAALPKMEAYLEDNHPKTRKPYEINPETYQLVNDFAGIYVASLGYTTIESDNIQPTVDINKSIIM